MESVPPPQAVLDAAYRCFCRTGYRRTTMTDIVEEAHVSRPTLYKYMGSKQEAVVGVVRSTLDRAVQAARTAAEDAETAAEKVLAVLTVKLDVAIRLWQDSPAHARDLLSAADALAPELIGDYIDALADLLTAALAEALPQGADQAAAVLLTFTRGLEDDLRDAEAARRELDAGVRMITRGALGHAEPAGQVLPTPRRTATIRRTTVTRKAAP